MRDTIPCPRAYHAQCAALEVPTMSAEASIAQRIIGQLERDGAIAALLLLTESELITLVAAWADSAHEAAQEAAQEAVSAIPIR